MSELSERCGQKDCGGYICEFHSLRSDAQEYILALESALKDAEEKLKEHDEYYRKVVNDECAPDELHCTCVPALRAEIDELKGYKESFLMSLGEELEKRSALESALKDAEEQVTELQKIIESMFKDIKSLPPDVLSPTYNNR